MADRGACFHHLWRVAHGHLFLPRPAVVGPSRDRRLDYRLAVESPARNHSRPSNPQPPDERDDRLLAAVAVAPLFDLPRDPSCASPGRQSHRSVRGPGELLLGRGQLGRLLPRPPRVRSREDHAARPHCARPGLPDRALCLRPRARRMARQARRARRPPPPPHPLRAGPDLGDRDLPHAALALPRLLHLSRDEPRPGALVRRASRRAGGGAPDGDRRGRLDSGAAVPVQQSACGPSPAPPPALVPIAKILPSQSRRADRAQRRPRLSRLFRCRAALSPATARQPGSSRLGSASGVSGEGPIAVLPMYDFVWAAAANDRLWAAIAARLTEVGVRALMRLARGGDLAAQWRDPRLVFKI